MMKMKKIVQVSFLSLTAACLILCTASCNLDDEESGTNEPTVTTALVTTAEETVTTAEKTAAETTVETTTEATTANPIVTTPHVKF